MKKSLAIILLLAVCAPLSPVHAGLHNRPTTISERAAGAERVVVGTVSRTEPVWQTNEYGDKLIVSHTYLNVEETMKGTPASEEMIDVEGGTINGLTLYVSDLPALKKGHRAVFFMKKGPSGNYRPYLREDGILMLDASNQIKQEMNLKLEQVRLSVRGKKSK